MKTVLTVLGILLLVAVLFVLIGVVSPGQKTETKVSVNAPIEHTWDIYNNQELLKEWVPGLKNIRLTSSKGGTVGSEYELTIVDPSGAESTSHQTITSMDRPNRFEIDYQNSMVTGSTSILFESLGDSTLLTAKNEYIGSSILLRSVLHFFAAKITNQTQQQYLDLKTLVESTYNQHQLTEPIKSDSLDVNSLNGIEGYPEPEGQLINPKEN